MNRGRKERKKWRDAKKKHGEAIKKASNACLSPKCIVDEQDITLSSRGFFTPCCWLDDELYWHQEWVHKFYREHLNITANNDIKDIFLSREWIDFYEMLRNNPQDAPPVCYEYCGGALETDKIIDVESHDDVNIITRAKH